MSFTNTPTRDLEKRWNAIARRIAAGDATSDEQRNFDAIATELARREKAQGSNAETRGAGSGQRTAQDEAFTRYLRTGDTSGLELRTDPPGMSADVTTQGGYTVAPDFWENLQIALKNYGGVSAAFKSLETDNGAPSQWPTLDPTGVTASLVAAENTQLSLDNPYVFGTGVLSAYTIATDPFLVSRQLMADTAFDVDALCTRLIGEAIGRQLATYAISGSGSSQPQGIITALNAKGAVGSGSGGFLGLTAATNVTTFGGTVTELVGNVLGPATVLKVVKSVDSAYWPNCAWWMSPAQALNQRGVVDSNGRPLLDFESGFEDGMIGRMAGFPVYVDPGIPNLTASTTGGPIFGDLASAMVMRTVRSGTSVLRLAERYADYLAYGYIGYVRVDMRSNDVRAAVTVKPAAT